MRYLAIDHGEKRIGLAFCDKLEIATQPLVPIKHKDTASTIEKINRIIDRNQIEEIVIGLPLSKTGKDTEQSKSVRKFLEKLKMVIKLPIHLWNETYSTQEALENMIQGGKKKKTRSKMIDSFSAMVILKSFLENKEMAE